MISAEKALPLNFQRLAAFLNQLPQIGASAIDCIVKRGHETVFRHQPFYAQQMHFSEKDTYFRLKNILYSCLDWVFSPPKDSHCRNAGR